MTFDKSCTVPVECQGECSLLLAIEVSTIRAKGLITNDANKRESSVRGSRPRLAR